MINTGVEIHTNSLFDHGPALTNHINNLDYIYQSLLKNEDACNKAQDLAVTITYLDEIFKDLYPNSYTGVLRND